MMIKRFIMGVLLVSSFFFTTTVLFGQENEADGASSDVASYDAAQLYKVISSVAKWQMENPGNHNHTDWTWGALLAGMTEWARAGDPATQKWLMNICEDNRWRLLKRSNRYHADDHAVGWSYLELYRLSGDNINKKDTIKRFNQILKKPADVPLVFTESGCKRWSWCDALFMAPPVWFNLYDISQDERYLNFADSEWWKTTDYLYDTEEQLYFRDSKFFDQKENNGEKVFWGRGNGWVFAGLPRVLKYFPKEHESYDRYVELYQEMAEKLVSIQGDDGFWRASLLDPDSYPAPETSATAFNCFGLLAGVNRGYLDDSYLEPGLKAWDALQTAVHKDGKLGWIQPIGEDPKKVTREMTEVYGVGGFLLAGSELYSMVKNGTIK